MRLIINGEPKRFDSALNVAELVEELGLNPTQVAVERGGVIVPKSQHDNTALNEGDIIEIVRFIGGG